LAIVDEKELMPCEKLVVLRKHLNLSLSNIMRIYGNAYWAGPPNPTLMVIGGT
tara:strand:+ start:487 stop:645 length:159 start_codon:yes stop_codon:yes gene_type:complete